MEFKIPEEWKAKMAEVGQKTFATTIAEFLKGILDDLIALGLGAGAYKLFTGRKARESMKRATELAREGKAEEATKELESGFAGLGWNDEFLAVWALSNTLTFLTEEGRVGEAAALDQSLAKLNSRELHRLKRLLASAQTSEQRIETLLGLCSTDKKRVRNFLRLANIQRDPRMEKVSKGVSVAMRRSLKRFKRARRRQLRATTQALNARIIATGRIP